MPTSKPTNNNIPNLVNTPERGIINEHLIKLKILPKDTTAVMLRCGNIAI